MVPYDEVCEVEGPQRINRIFLPYIGFWWPVLDVSLLLLLQGRIQMLRLEYTERYKRGKSEDGKEVDSNERFEAIRRLRSKCQNSPEWNFAVKWASNVGGDGGTVLELTKLSRSRLMN